MIRLYIENKELDVSADFTHQITYAVDDLNNLDSKSTNFSKTIVLPGTANNNALLGNIFEFANSNFSQEGANVGYNFNASKGAKCRMDSDGLTIIKGVLRLLEIVRTDTLVEYEVAIFGELGGFFSKLSNKKLTDLDFSAYNHDFTMDDIYSFWKMPGDFVYQTLQNGLIFNNDELWIIGINLINKIPQNGSFTILSTTTGHNTGSVTCTSVTYDAISNSTKITKSGGNFAYNETTEGRIMAPVDGCGVFYPLIDYGNYSTDKRNYNIKTFRPALHAYEYIDKIITNAGYTYESKFFNTDFFRRLIIPNNEAVFTANQTKLFDANVNSYYDTNGGSGYNTGQFGANIDRYLNVNKLLGDLFTTSDNQTFTYNGSNTNILLNYSLYFQLKAYARTYTVQIKVIKNGNNTGIGTYDSGYFNTWDPITKHYTITDQLLSIATNDTLVIRWTITYSSQDPLKIGTHTTDFLINLFGNKVFYNAQYPIVSPIEIGSLVEVNRTIPKNVLQKDFFASILKMFYLMVTEDKYKSKHLIIEPWTWFYDLNKSSYIDWSGKLDKSQVIKIKPMSEANARFYDLKFKSDNDYFNELYRKKYSQGYGDMRYDNELEFAKESETTEVIFSSTPLLGYLDEDKVVPTIFKWDGKNVGVNEDRVTSNIRIMQKKMIDGVSTWSVKDNNNNILGSYTRYPYAGHFDDPDVPGSDINFGATNELYFALASGALGNNLFNIFYSSYIAEITDKDSRLVTAKFKLNDIDIFNLDFGKFIYLDGVLYRLQKIIDYTPGELCTVELLRVISTTYDSVVSANAISSGVPDVNELCGAVWDDANFGGVKYRNGLLIPKITDGKDWDEAEFGAWCYKDFDDNNAGLGKYYNWYALTSPNNIAPAGYRIPNLDDVDSLITCLTDRSMDAYNLMEPGTNHWLHDNGINSFNFNAWGNGYYKYSTGDGGIFSEFKGSANFWLEDYSGSDGFVMYLKDNQTGISTALKSKNHAYSIRLIKTA